MCTILAEEKITEKITDINAQNELMRKIIIASFNACSCEKCGKLEFSTYGGLTEVTIKNISFNEDLLTVIQHLREYFYVDIRARVEEAEFDGEDGKKETYNYGRIDLELILRE